MNTIITLNVGGQLFTTSRETLSQPIGKRKLPHFFSAMFSNSTNSNFEILKDQHGNVFIDRDGSNFHFILNYLRNSGDVQKTILPSVRTQPFLARLVQIEAEFFGLSELVEYFQIQKWLLKRKFQNINCHPNVSVLDDGRTLVCKDSTGKNWYSVAAKYPILMMDHFGNTNNNVNNLIINDILEMDDEDNILENDSQQLIGFPLGNNILSQDNTPISSFNNTDIFQLQQHQNTTKFIPNNKLLDEYQFAASQMLNTLLDSGMNDIKLLEYHIKNYYEITIENTKNFNIVLGIAKQKTAYYLDSWTVGFISNSYGFNVWSIKKYTKKNQIDYGERCERGDRIGLYVNTELGYLEYFRNGRSLGIAFDNLQKELSEGKWYVVVSLYNQGDTVSLNPKAWCISSSKEEEYFQNLMKLQEEEDKVMVNAPTTPTLR